MTPPVPPIPGDPITTTLGIISILGSLFGGSGSKGSTNSVPSDVQGLRSNVVNWLQGGAQQGGSTTRNPYLMGMAAPSGFGPFGGFGTSQYLANRQNQPNSTVGMAPPPDFNRIFGRTPTPPQSIDQIATADNSFFVNELLSRYQPLFTQQREEALAQAKEQSGNLTGSGLAENLGGVVNRSLAQEQAIIADVLNNLISQESARQMGVFGTTANMNSSNANNFLSLLLGLTTGGVGTPQPTYTPGAADYFTQLLPFIGQFAGGINRGGSAPSQGTQLPPSSGSRG